MRDDFLADPKIVEEPPIFLDQLSRELAEHQELSIAQSRRIILAFAEIIGDHLKCGRRVIIKGLGRLIVKHCAARVVRNPKTGEKIQFPSTKRVRFKASSGLEMKLFGKPDERRSVEDFWESHERNSTKSV